jgi:hypothetical protein
MELDAVKERVAGYWDRWADGYDLQYAHGLKGEAERVMPSSCLFLIALLML